MNTKELNQLQEYKQTPHYRISQFATPLCVEIKETLPVSLDISDINYTFLQKSIRRLGSALVYDGKNQADIRVHRALISPLLDDIRREIFVHEIAHILAYRWKGYPEWGHGFYWGFIMIAMGFEPSRCATEETVRDIRRAEELDKLTPFKMMYCVNCNAEVMAELIDYRYVCQECNTHLKGHSLPRSYLTT